MEPVADEEWLCIFFFFFFICSLSSCLHVSVHAEEGGDVNAAECKCSNGMDVLPFKGPKNRCWLKKSTLKHCCCGCSWTHSNCTLVHYSSYPPLHCYWSCAKNMKPHFPWIRFIKKKTKQVFQLTCEPLRQPFRRTAAGHVACVSAYSQLHDLSTCKLCCCSLQAFQDHGQIHTLYFMRQLHAVAWQFVFFFKAGWNSIFLHVAAQHNSL